MTDTISKDQQIPIRQFVYSFRNLRTKLGYIDSVIKAHLRGDITHGINLDSQIKELEQIFSRLIRFYGSDKVPKGDDMPKYFEDLFEAMTHIIDLLKKKKYEDLDLQSLVQDLINHERNYVPFYKKMGYDDN